MDGMLDDHERWIVPLSLWGSFLANDGEELLTIRTRGRGALYQDVQLAFGAHGFGHLAAALALGRYASGVATSPTVVLPQWWWAASRLRRAGVPGQRGPATRRAAGGWLAGCCARDRRACLTERTVNSQDRAWAWTLGLVAIHQSEEVLVSCEDWHPA